MGIGIGASGIRTRASAGSGPIPRLWSDCVCHW